jgi:hypothetical protein
LNKYFAAIVIVTIGFIVERIRRDRRSGIAILSGWLVPGLGQVMLGHKTRGIILGGTVVALFLAGLVLTSFCGVAPFGRHDIWAIAQGFAGGLFWITALATKGMIQQKDLPLYQIGCLYAASAGLLNLLLLLDVYDIGCLQKAQKLAAAERAPVEGKSA